MEAQAAPFLPGYLTHSGHTVRKCFFCLRCGGLPTDHEQGFQGKDGPCEGPRGHVPAMVVSALARRAVPKSDEPQDPLRLLMLQNLVIRCKELCPLLGTKSVRGYRRPVGAAPFCPPADRAVAADAGVPLGTPEVMRADGAAIPPLPASSLHLRLSHLKRAGPTLSVALHRSKKHCAGPGPHKQREDTGRATLWAAFARGVGPPRVHAVVAGCPRGGQ